MSDLVLSPPPPQEGAARPKPRRRPRPRPLLAKAHRWSSFALGLLLLVVVLSGTILLLAPEIEQLTHPELYDTAPGPARITPREALQTVHRELPKVDVAGATAVDNRGAWEVLTLAGEIVRVDSTDSRLLGVVDRNHGVMGFLANLHECGLTCEEMSGYVAFLAKPAQIDGFDLSLGNEGTWGGMILLLSAVVLLGLSLSGLLLWWPGRLRLRRGLAIRRGRGRYKFQYDLHKVVGFLALPFLAMWAITGVNFELPKQMEAAWYAITPGDPQPESDFEFESRPGSGPGIGMAAAIERAAGELPAGSRLIAVSDPDRSEKTSYYELWWSHGIDPYAHGTFPGNYGVYVDRYSGRAVRFWPNPRNGSATSVFWQDWISALHMGIPVGWVPRLGWVAFGLAPLLLAVTGITTWVIRRRLGRGRRPSREDEEAASR